MEGEVGLVCTLDGHTLVVEVSADMQHGAKRKKPREWHAGDFFAGLSSAPGLPASKILTVYVDMSWSMDLGGRGGIDWEPVLGSGHIEGLAAEGPEAGQAVLLERCGAWGAALAGAREVTR